MKECSDDFLSKLLKNWTAQYPTPVQVRKRLLIAAEFSPFYFPPFSTAAASLYTVLPQNFSHAIFNWESPHMQLELTWKRNIVG